MNYILYGEQYPMIKKRLKKVLAERVGEVDDFNVVKFDYNPEKVDEIIDEASMLPLGYDSKAVVIDNASFLEAKANKEIVDRFLKLVENGEDSINIFFILRNENLDSKNPIVNYVKEHGQIFEFLNLKKEEWPIYIRKYFKERNVEIDPNAVDELALRVDGDLMRFVNEAEKLCLYKDHLTVADITLMVSKPLEDDAFQITNALFRGDNASALSIFRDIRLLGSNSTDGLIPMLGAQFRFASQVMFLSSRGLDRQEIAKQLNANEWRVKITLGNCRRLSRRQIAHALDDLYYLDYQIKSGQINRFYGLELFLINFPN